MPDYEVTDQAIVYYADNGDGRYVRHVELVPDDEIVVWRNAINGPAEVGGTGRVVAVGEPWHMTPRELADRPDWDANPAQPVATTAPSRRGKPKANVRAPEPQEDREGDAPIAPEEPDHSETEPAADTTPPAEGEVTNGSE